MILKKIFQTACLFLLAMNFCSVSAADGSTDIKTGIEDSLVAPAPVVKAVTSDGCSIITARSGSNSTEGATKAFDNSISTKWYCYETTGTIWLQYQYCNGASWAVNSYSLTSANDMPLRDPKSVLLYGSNDGVNFVRLDSRNDLAFTARYQKKTFTFSNSTSYKIYKFEFTAGTGNDGLQISEIELMNGTVTSTPAILTDGCSVLSAASGSISTEDAARAFDNNASTKWYYYLTTGTVWIKYQFCNSASYAANSYSLTSANDMPLRDPKTAILYGSNDGVNYTTLDSRSNIAFTSRYQKQTFSFSNSTAYRYYKFEFVANAGNDGMQLAEIELMSSGTPPTGSGPAAPSGLSALFNASELIGLAWTDNSTNETSFVIEQSLYSSFSPLQTSYTLAANITRNVVKGLAANTRYYFRIKSSNGSGSSAYSGILNVLTGPVDNFPLAMSSGKLVTKSGAPYLIVGDSPWSLIVGPNMAGIDKYLENRKQKGVNSLIMNLVEHYYNGPADAYGNMPFTVTGDFSTPNPKYFDNVDYVIGKAREKGMEVFLLPAYLGYNDGGSHIEGWYTEINANGPSKMYQYGRYVGQRYKDFKNIVWVMGGDCAPGTTLDEIREMVRGIEETAGPQIFTVHNARYQSGITAYPGESWIDLNTTYACKTTTASYLKADYQRNFPFFYYEGTYENMGVTASNLRGEMYLPLLLGAKGYFFGNYPLFEFESGWDDPSVLESQGSLDLKRSALLLKSRLWNSLVPDVNHTLLTNGYGDVSTARYAAAALTVNAGTAIIYVPDYRVLTVNLTRISGTQTHAWWYQPSNGYVVDASIYNDVTAQSFYPPSSTTDWLLVLDDASLGYGAPGTANPLLKSIDGEEIPVSNTVVDSDDAKSHDFIYPNPARDQFRIMMDVSAEASVTIYDLQGKMILSERVNENTVDVSMLPHGIYVVKLVDNEKILIGRLVKE